MFSSVILLPVLCSTLKQRNLNTIEIMQRKVDSGIGVWTVKRRENLNSCVKLFFVKLSWIIASLIVILVCSHNHSR